MVTLAKQIFAPFLLLVVTWVVLTLAFTEIVGHWGGYWKSMALTPFNMVHLLEAADTGEYNPFHNGGYLLYEIVVSFTAFGVATYFAVTRSPNTGALPTLLPSCLGLLLLLWLFRDVCSTDYPQTMRFAFIYKITLCAVGAGLGYTLARRAGRLQDGSNGVSKRGQ